MRPLLIIEDDRPLAEGLKNHLSDFDARIATTPEEGEAAMTEIAPSVVLSDLGFPNDVSVGLDLITRLLRRDPSAKIIVMTGFGSREVGTRAVERGAYAYIEKPIRDFQSLRVILEAASQVAYLEREIRDLKKDPRPTGLVNLIGHSPAIESVFRQIREVAAVRTTVLIEGESGTGKERVARAIHELSERKGPLIILDCTAIPENLVEDKLFGHERGAFTGASAEMKGALEMADQGTLFIDEIGELPPPLQAKLLRFLQEKSFQRIGSHKELAVDARVVAATHRDLRKEVEAGRFREDLYWRLNVYTIRLPPLRERREDLPILVSHFVQKYSEELGKGISRVAPSTLAKLSGYDWPGNVRELENLIQRGILVASGAVLLPEHLNPFGGEAEGGLRLADLEARWKGHWIREALARSGGRLEETADQLGISKRQLQRYTRQFSIEWKKYVGMILIGFSLFAPSAYGEGTKRLTLDQLISRALETRPEIGIADSLQDEVKALQLKARAASLPHLDLTSSFLRFDESPHVTLGSFETEAVIDMRRIKEEFPVLGAGPDQVSVPIQFPDTRVGLFGANLFSTGVTLRQPLFAGGRIRERKRQSDLGLKMARLEGERTRREVASRVRELYVRWLYAAKGRHLLSEAAKRAVIIERFLKNLHENYLPREGEKGVGREDWLRGSVLASQILAKRDQALAQEEIALKDLQNFCRVEGEGIEERVPEFRIPPLTEARGRIEKNPAAGILAGQVALATSEIRFARGSQLPEVGLAGFVSYTLDDSPSEPFIAGGGVTLRFPLFDSFDKLAEVRRARSLARRKGLESERTREEINEAVESLYLAKGHYESSIGSLKEAEARARERREMAQESYLMNFGDYEDYLEALKDEIEAAGLLLAAELSYHEGLVKLESLIGEEASP